MSFVVIFQNSDSSSNPGSSIASSGHVVLISFNLEQFLDFFLSFLKIFIYLFLERDEGREKEKERNINVWLPLMRPLLGPGPQPRHVPWLGIQLATLVPRPALNPLSHSSQGNFFFLDHDIFEEYRPVFCRMFLILGFMFFYNYISIIHF